MQICLLFKKVRHVVYYCDLRGRNNSWLKRKAFKNTYVMVIVVMYS